MIALEQMVEAAGLKVVRKTHQYVGNNPKVSVTLSDGTVFSACVDGTTNTAWAMVRNRIAAHLKGKTE